MKNKIKTIVKIIKKCLPFLILSIVSVFVLDRILLENEFKEKFIFYKNKLNSINNSNEISNEIQFLSLAVSFSNIIQNSSLENTHNENFQRDILLHLKKSSVFNDFFIVNTNNKILLSTSLNNEIDNNMLMSTLRHINFKGNKILEIYTVIINEANKNPQRFTLAYAPIFSFKSVNGQSSKLTLLGAVIGIIRFDLIDMLLKSDDHFNISFVSPEGLIFASNNKKWLFNVIGDESNILEVLSNHRTREKFIYSNPKILRAYENTLIDLENNHYRFLSSEIRFPDSYSTWKIYGYINENDTFFTSNELIFLFIFVFVFSFYIFDNFINFIVTYYRRSLHLEKENKDLKLLSEIDYITGLVNRRSMNTLLTNEWSRAKRCEAPLSIIMIDIDFFKLFNDLYGHVEGDNNLIAVATTLNACVRRSSDVVARYGGEEFCAILPETNKEAAATIAATMREKVEALGLKHEKSPFNHVTISLGVATIEYIDRHSKHEPHELITLADQALYQAKQNGKNCYVQFTFEQ